MSRGVGTELHKLLESLGVEPDAICDCDEKRQEWDRLSIEWCAEHKDELVSHLREAYAKTDWLTVLRAGSRAAVLGLPITIEGLVDLAIERAGVPITKPLERR